jgi:hypothetical protein
MELKSTNIYNMAYNPVIINETVREIVRQIDSLISMYQFNNTVQCIIDNTLMKLISNPSNNFQLGIQRLKSYISKRLELEHLTPTYTIEFNIIDQPKTVTDRRIPLKNKRRVICRYSKIITPSINNQRQNNQNIQSS